MWTNYKKWTVQFTWCSPSIIWILSASTWPSLFWNTSIRQNYAGTWGHRIWIGPWAIAADSLEQAAHHINAARQEKQDTFLTDAASAWGVLLSISNFSLSVKWAWRVGSMGNIRSDIAGKKKEASVCHSGMHPLGKPSQWRTPFQTITRVHEKAFWWKQSSSLWNEGI